VKARIGIILVMLAVMSLSAHAQASTALPGDGTRRGGTDNPAAGVVKGRVAGGAVLRDTFSLKWETRVEPAEPKLGSEFETRTVDGPGAIHRIMLDRTRRTYFGYDILVEALGDAGGYRVTLSPLEITPEGIEVLLADKSTRWTPMPQPRFPPPLIAQSGDVVVFDLLVNPATSQKIVDYVTVQAPSRVP
jgi:hypothetical protein